MTPCRSCRPETHPFNEDVLKLYLTCSDQYIMGVNGPIGISDIAIQSAMKAYFTVAKEDRLELSLGVRALGKLVIKALKDLHNG